MDSESTRVRYRKELVVYRRTLEPMRRWFSGVPRRVGETAVFHDSTPLIDSETIDNDQPVVHLGLSGESGQVVGNMVDHSRPIGGRREDQISPGQLQASSVFVSKSKIAVSPVFNLANADRVAKFAPHLRANL